MKRIAIFCFVTIASCAHIIAQVSYRSYPKADKVIQSAIADSLIPGAVLCVIDSGSVVCMKAYGCKALVPEREEMTVNSVFDLASVSKSTGAGSAVLLLISQGRLHKDDPVWKYLPRFRDYISSSYPFAPQSITIHHLLKHTSGLPSYLYVRRLDSLYRIRPISDLRTRPQYLIDTIATVKRLRAPGLKYTYSCLNFITLQNVVQTIVGENLNTFMRRSLYTPLGTEVMGWLPADTLMSRIVPTELTVTGCVPAEQRTEVVLRGTVHDPLARVMNEGVSGNAGVYATASDLALWCNWLMSQPDSIREAADNCGLWTDDDGALYHTGYTGTCIRLYPDKKRAIILLANRVHPHDKGNLNPVRRAVFDAILNDDK